MRYCFLTVISVILIVSCKNSTEPIQDVGLDYFPLIVGAYQIYTVDETQINQSVEQKFIYELKVKVVDSAINQENGYTYTIQRQKRDNATSPWSSLDSWTARFASRQAIIKEGNTAVVKLMFPATNGLEWDGNAFNTLGGEQSCGENKNYPCDIYRLENFGKEFVLTNGMTFAETLTVIQNDNPDLIVKQDVRKEVFAKNIGLIYKESTVLEYCTATACLGKQKVDKGYKYKQTLKEYGSD